MSFLKVISIVKEINILITLEKVNEKEEIREREGQVLNDISFLYCKNIIQDTIRCILHRW